MVTWGVLLLPGTVECNEYSVKWNAATIALLVCCWSSCSTTAWGVHWAQVSVAVTTHAHCYTASGLRVTGR